METIKVVEKTYIPTNFSSWEEFKCGYFAIESKIAALESQGFSEISVAIEHPFYTENNEGRFSISYTRPMTVKEIEASNKRTAKAREAGKKAAEKRKEQDMKELARLKAKYEG